MQNVHHTAEDGAHTANYSVVMTASGAAWSSALTFLRSPIGV